MKFYQFLTFFITLFPFFSLSFLFLFLFFTFFCYNNQNKKGDKMGFSGFIAVALCVIATGMMLSIVAGAVKKSPIKD